MNDIEIDARFVRGAQACQASNDIRYYLNGICIMPDGRIAGTNGHVLYVGKYSEDQDSLPDRNIILKLHGTIPRAAKSVRFTFTARAGDVWRGVAVTDNNKAFCFETIDGKYPDIDRVIPEAPEPDGIICDGFGIQARYLSLVPKTLGVGESVICQHAEPNGPAVFRLHSADKDGCDLFAASSRLIVMPAWLKATYRSGQATATQTI
ncbi:MAG: hypothetical protein CME59_02360 [Halioglobus sp.]|nr:hypothetical protein [Halioglobus sp.]|tara:strand:+ start:273 stop:893 length:621 start_codon:yes stop_codon:yes gene_type:complete